MKKAGILILFGLIVLPVTAVIMRTFVAIEPVAAPSVRFTMLDGSRPKLDELRGNPVMLTFWATSCAACMQEIPHLVALHEKYAAQGMAIIAVAMAYDSPDQVVEFQQRRQLPYQISLDIDGTIAAAFGGIAVTPTTILISPRGEIEYARKGLFDSSELSDRISNMLQAGTRN